MAAKHNCDAQFQNLTEPTKEVLLRPATDRLRHPLGVTGNLHRYPRNFRRALSIFDIDTRSTNAYSTSSDSPKQSLVAPRLGSIPNIGYGR